jgi:hypothetical protein
MKRARPLFPLAAALAACWLASGCKRAPLACGSRAGCEAGIDAIGVGGAGGTRGDAGLEAAAGRPTVDAAADADAPVSDAGDAADAGPSGSAACASNPAGPSQAFIGTAIDFDEDGIPDSFDDCPWAKNPTQADTDGDWLGDACDRCPGGTDTDQDGVCDAADDCPAVWNPSQTDVDGDGVGDACDTQACNSAPGMPETQRYLGLLLGHSEVFSLLVGHRWRLASADSFCTNGNKHGVVFTIYDYDGRQSISVSLDVGGDILSTLRMQPFDATGPQASPAESWEAITLARADATVQQRSAATGASNALVFFFEFANDPRFSACDAGRCVDVLFETSVAAGSQIVFDVVVDLETCRVLGIADSPR